MVAANEAEPIESHISAVAIMERLGYGGVNKAGRGSKALIEKLAAEHTAARGKEEVSEVTESQFQKSVSEALNKSTELKRTEEPS